MMMACLCALAGVTALPGCAKKETYRPEEFKPNTPFSQRIPGRGKEVCWSVKRAFLSQGYMLDRGGDTLIMTGTKDYQPDSETNIALRLQATCVDNKDGTSTVFASATREISKIQSVGHSTTIGAWIATLSLPSGTDKMLRVQKRETVEDPDFYQRFYALVERFATEEKNSSEN
jgi:hypothetical protein